MKPSIVIVTVALRSSYVVLGLQLTDIVIGPSEAAPEEGETETQKSEEATVQFRFAENVRVELPPSAFNSILDGPEYMNSGSF